MHYIVLDLEWNQNPYGPAAAKKSLPFEIIEIGAVKLNEDLEIVDSYQQVIRPKVYKKLHYKIQEITHFTEEELKSGISFKKAIEDFLDWCGQDYRFTTWGNMDLIELQKNMKFYGLERVLDYPLIYVDLQKMFSLRYDDGRMKRTLLNAVEFLEIEEDSEFHRALADAYYTAKVMQTMDFEKYKERLSVDTFYAPRIEEEEIFIRFDTYSKFVSREYFSKEEMFENESISSMKCNICDRDLDRELDWFSDSGKTYFSLGRCEEHGYVRGKIRIKKNEDTCFFAVKIMKSTDEEGAESIREKQRVIREKRRERRLRMLEKEIAISELWDDDDKFDEDDED